MTTLAAPLASPASSERFLGSEVLDQLCARGCDPERRPGETADGHLDRIDTALMAWFRDSGRREAFDALYRHSHARVWTWLRWVVAEQRAKLDPIELLQDTYVNVYRYARGFRSDHGGSFRVWVRTIASNVVRRTRSVAARLRHVSADDHAFLVADSEHRSPQARAMEGEEAQGLRGACAILLQHYLAAFERLSPRDRRALELVEVQGLSYAQACDVLGVGPSNMKMIMLRARRRLLAHMAASMGSLEALAA
jgi:RNA polymerase sigma factor (sigma-70 family)